MTAVTHLLLLPRQTQEKADWAKTAAIVAIAMGAILLLVTVLSMYSALPNNLLGGLIGKGLCLFTGASLVISGGFTLYLKHKK